MKPKQILILSIAAGLLAMIVAQMQLRSARGQTVGVYRATADVRPGEKLGGRVEPVRLPGENLFPNLLKEAPTGAEMAKFVAETPLRQPIAAGEIVLYQHLEGTADPGIRAAIPAGMKAVSVPVDEETSVSYLVRPGDTVDVLAALPRAPTAFDLQSAVSGDGHTARAGLETRPLLQAVKVLAVGRRDRPSAPSLRDDSYEAVTLLVSLAEAQKLVYARDVLKSPMTLVLRSPRDTGKQEAVPSVTLDSPEFDRIGNQ
jgi:Flp pilus assembly protein CpaB